ncbi:MAG: hypothetical protein FLDDKLPJ_00666 [Phycisphaerae bacterium]|nr:hypothetical protein [Phycisphaerae bacterium]
MYRRHAVEVHDLTNAEVAAFTADLLRVSAAVKRLRRAVKMNLASLGNLVPHLHVHVCPRSPGDRFEGRPLDPGDVCGDVYADAEHESYVAALRLALAPSCPQ